MKFYLSILSSVLLLIIISCKSDVIKQQKPVEKIQSPFTYQTIGHIERIDPALNKIIPPNAKIELLGKGMVWSEGPLWLPKQQMLICSDVKENRIYKWTEKEGLVPFLEPSGFTGQLTDSRERGSNGLTLNPHGKLVMCHHGDRRVAEYTGDFKNPKPSFKTIVGDYKGKKFNSPNDLIYDRNGNLFFTDPPFGLSEAMMDDPKKELPFQGIYKYTSDGELHLLSKEMSRPNGLALSPDETTLYVANTDPNQAVWMAFPITADGMLGTGKVLHDATHLIGKEVGFPDGIKVDQNGNIFTAGPGGLWIFDPNGKVLGKIKPGEWVSNCNFDETGKVLFITADDNLLRVKL